MRKFSQLIQPNRSVMQMTESKEQSINKKAEIKTNIIVNLIFILLFSLIYEIIVFNNFASLGDVDTGGGFFSYGFTVLIKFFFAAAVSVIVAVILWKQRRLAPKLTPMLIIAVCLPVLLYQVNLHIFTDGFGSEFRERHIIVSSLKKAENTSEGEMNTDLLKHPICLAEKDNGSFYACLYINSELDDPYFFFRRNPESQTTYGDSRLSVFSGERSSDIDEPSDINQIKTIQISQYGIDSVRLYPNALVINKTDGERLCCFSEDIKWLLDVR